MPGSQVPSVDMVEVRLRGSSCDRRDSSVAPSQLESFVGVGGPGFSPAPMIRDSPAIGEDYRFQGIAFRPFLYSSATKVTHDKVDAQDESLNRDSQRSDMNVISLERNSYNFLE
jgi:meiotic recombination protein REC8